MGVRQVGKGGSSDSSQRSSTSVVTENHNLQDNLLGMAGSDNNNINIDYLSDDVALEAMNLSKGVLALSGAVSKTALEQALQGNREVSQDAIKAIMTANRDQASINIETLIKWGAPALAVVALAVAAKSRG